MHTVLLVEDERWVRVSLKRIIEKTGMPFQVVHECANGLEALDWLKQHDADVVLTDIRMPVMGGMELARQLQEERPEQDVVIITGHDDFELVQSALRAGVCDYLLKPIEVGDMKTSLQRLQKRLHQRESRPAEAHVERDPAELSAVEQVVRLIKERMPGEITLQEAAAHVHLNASYLSQLFKLQMKTNFVDYVLTLRMEEAKRLLAKTSLRISEIAERLGYTDVSYFSNTYKRTMGQTPSEYRKENQLSAAGPSSAETK
ncbi:response regulator transcription factor [Paenibacillus hamazuiensis]|uniref:response regulator transcription factor n=1 Tax=Paenibacillus hamazuiensis TaxID=2936508 RepID=UPI00200E2E78|nr:response regulator [Paenibacillus hamazuiensis]